jgi:hypothetical protein
LDHDQPVVSVGSPSLIYEPLRCTASITSCASDANSSNAVARLLLIMVPALPSTSYKKDTRSFTPSGREAPRKKSGGISQGAIQVR